MFLFLTEFDKIGIKNHQKFKLYTQGKYASQGLRAQNLHRLYFWESVSERLSSLLIITCQESELLPVRGIHRDGDWRDEHFWVAFCKQTDSIFPEFLLICV